MNDQIKEFDEQHILFKNFRYTKSAEICKNIQNNLKNKVKHKYNMAQEILEKWEIFFYNKL